MDPNELESLRESARLWEELEDELGVEKMIPLLHVIQEWRRDAERYRWLRDVADGVARDVAFSEARVTADEEGHAAANARAVDQAIDAAMKK